MTDVSLIEILKFASENSIMYSIFLLTLFAVGFSVNFIYEFLYDTFLRENIVEDVFQTVEEYYHQRNVVFQTGSNYALKDIHDDRIMLRILRASSINFLFISVSLLFYIKFNWLLVIFLIAICILLAAFSYLQWRSRAKSVYSKIHGCYLVIKGSNEKSNK